MIHVEAAPHEFSGNLIFDEHGLRPYFGLDAAIKQNDGHVRTAFDIDGEKWVAELYYTRDNGLVHPGDETPTGTEFELETIREFGLKVERSEMEDETGQQGFHVNISPRWQGLEAERNDGTRTEINIPADIEEGLNLRVQGSNIEFSRYLTLTQRAFSAVGVRRHYFADPHAHSNIQDAERYVRIDRDDSGPIHGRDGPLARMGHLLEGDREGYRKVVQNDNDERGEKLPGYYHTVTLGTKRIREAFPNHDLPKEVKHYYAREAKDRDRDDPLAHPKLGASYQVSRYDGKLSWTDDAIANLNYELEQTVLSVIANAGIQVHNSPNGPYIEDSYFDAENIERDDDPIISLDLTQIEQDQSNVVIKHLRGGLSPVEFESLSTLVSDGGTVAPSDIADEHGRHVGSVRRALRRMDELVQSEYGDVSLRSPHVAELVHKAVQDAERANQRAADTAAKALEAAERGLNEGVSAMVSWAANRGIDLADDEQGYAEINLGLIEADDVDDAMNEIRRLLRDGKRVWTRAGRDPKYWEGGEWSANIVYDKFANAKTISRETRKNSGGYIGATT